MQVLRFLMPIHSFLGLRAPVWACNGVGEGPVKEEAFRLQVRKIARMYGWTLQYHTHSSLRSDKGYPDETWINVDRKRILFIEFKSDKGRIRPEQQQWIDALKAVGQEAAIWRPKDMDLVVEVLGPKQRNLLDGSVNGVEEDAWVFAPSGGCR